MTKCTNLLIVGTLSIWLATGISTSLAAEPLGIKQVHRYRGPNAGVKIVKCFAALPETGGTCDARGLSGTQIIDRNIFEGINKNVTLILGHAIYNISAPQRYKPNRREGSLKIVGQGLGTVLKPTTNMSVLSADMRAEDGVLSIYQYVYITDVSFDLNNTDSTAVDLIAAGQKTVLSRLFVQNNYHLAEAPLIKVGHGPTISTAETAHSTTLRDLRLRGNSLKSHGVEVNSTITTIDGLDCTGTFACVSLGIQSISGFTVANSRLDASIHALLVLSKAIQGLTYASNRAEDNQAEHIKIVGLAASPSTSLTQSVTIRDSYFTGMGRTGQNGIYLEKVNDVILEGNVFKSPEAGTQGDVFGVVLGPDVSNIFLAGNGVRLDVSTEMPGFDAIPLVLNDLTVTQASRHAPQ